MPRHFLRQELSAPSAFYPALLVGPRKAGHAAQTLQLALGRPTKFYELHVEAGHLECPLFLQRCSPLPGEPRREVSLPSASLRDTECRDGNGRAAMRSALLV